MESEPPNYSTMFEARKIQITFDEFIVLDNVNQELIVSPPMEEKPEVRLRKKTIVIQFEEELKQNTTYTFNFGNSIKDLHEGNKLQNFEYVFSTGEVLDSLSVRGTLNYADDLSRPEEPVSIMLYEDLRDSVPLTDIPLYVGRSNDSGMFSVNNLRPDVYKVFVLKDGNNNFLFDLPSEEIAFLDSSLIVNATFARKLWEQQDTTGMQSDTTKPGTLIDSTGTDTVAPILPDLNSIYIDLLLFVEDMEIQYLTDYKREDPRKIEMSFAKPLTDTFRFRFLGSRLQDPGSYLPVFSADRDSLTLWIRDSTDYRRDTLRMRIDYTVKDTADNWMTQADTLLLTYRKRRGQKDEPEEPEKLQLRTIRKGGEQDLHKDLAIRLDLPISEFRDSLISVFMIPDSVEVPADFTFRPDSLRPTRGWVSVPWESASKYRMLFLPGAVRSIYPPVHDTVDVTFTTRDMEYYGRILLQLQNVRGPILVQLLRDENVVRRQVADRDGLLIFPYLNPGDYRVKFIHDMNGNGRWDTGDYLEKRQPEPVEFLPGSVTVRSNWDHDVTMELKK